MTKNQITRQAEEIFNNYKNRKDKIYFKFEFERNQALLNMSYLFNLKQLDIIYDFIKKDKSCLNEKIIDVLNFVVENYTLTKK